MLLIQSTAFGEVEWTSEIPPLKAAVVVCWSWPHSHLCVSLMRNVCVRCPLHQCKVGGGPLVGVEGGKIQDVRLQGPGHGSCF